MWIQWIQSKFNDFESFEKTFENNWRQKEKKWTKDLTKEWTLISKI
jgi:hypothetical protein